MTPRRKGKLRSFIGTLWEVKNYIRMRAPGKRWLKKMIRKGERREVNKLNDQIIEEDKDLLAELRRRGD